jgi:acyl carrier protein
VNDHELRAAVAAALHRIAPEADLDTIDPHAELRDELDLDSMDFLNFVEELYTRTGVDIPERDYPSVNTLARCQSYLAARLPQTQRA